MAWLLILPIIILVFLCIPYSEEIRGGGGGGDNIIDTIDKLVRNPVITMFYDKLPRLKYKQGGEIANFNCHIGQRKLLLNEIQFLSYHLSPGKRNYIIYVGAAPCEHLTVIDEMFPGNVFLLIDPNYIISDINYKYIFQNKDSISDEARRVVSQYARSSREHQRSGAARLKNVEFIDGTKLDALNQPVNSVWSDFVLADLPGNVFVIQDYMSIELSKKLVDLLPPDIYLISDLRTNLFSEGPTDTDILYNDCLNIAMLDILKPKYSMLKFHPPYFPHEDSVINEHPAIGEVIDYVADISGIDIYEMFKNKQHYHYQAEKILLQPWSPRGSSEARLIIPRKYVINKKFALYDSTEWDDKFYAFRFMRSYSYIDTYKHTKPLYDNCYDCYIEVTILLEYLLGEGKARNFPKNRGEVYKLTKMINRSINHNLIERRSNKCMIHGYMQKNPKRNFYYKKIGSSCIRYSPGEPPISDIKDSEFIIRDNMKPLSKFDDINKNVKDSIGMDKGSSKK